MIRKPPVQVHRESLTVRRIQDLHAVASTGVTMARAGSFYISGLICWCLALLWGFPALVAGLFGQLPTLIGVGLLAAFMGWMGTRMFAEAQACRQAPAPMVT